MTPALPNRNTQRGAVLAIGLILLSVATLVTLTAMNTGIMQESMTANQDNNARSFMAAEAGGADLVSWVIANEGLPTTDPQLTGTVDGDPLMTYELDTHPTSNTWSERPLRVLIEGRSLSAGGAVLARTELLIEFEGDPPPSWPDAPAAISCFNGPCSIEAGRGKGADQPNAEQSFGLVSGYNHPIPTLPCGGDNCRTQPQDLDRNTPAVPAVYLGEGAEGSSVSLQAGNPGGRNPGGSDWPRYQGLGPDGTAVEGNDTDSVAVGPDAAIYPRDGENSTAPTWDNIFPEDPKSNPEAGILVIDTDYTMTGTSIFVGVIVIRNCGSLTMSGNPNVYGAIIIDAEGCPQPYKPFGSNGTPAVRFVGGEEGGGGTGTGGSGLVTRWSEYLP